MSKAFEPIGVSVERMREGKAVVNALFCYYMMQSTIASMLKILMITFSENVFTLREII